MIPPASPREKGPEEIFAIRSIRGAMRRLIEKCGMKIGVEKLVERLLRSMNGRIASTAGSAASDLPCSGGPQKPGLAVALACLWLLVHLAPVCAAAPQAGSSLGTNDLNSLICRLGAATFAQRRAARDALSQLLAAGDPAVLSECVCAYRRSDDPEVRLQLLQLLMEVFEDRIRKFGRGFLGIRLEPVRFAGQDGRIWTGIRIVGFLPDSAAAKAGLREGDIIVSADSLDLDTEPDPSMFTSYIQSRIPGSRVVLRVFRGEEIETVDVTLGAIPEDLQENMAMTDTEKKRLFRLWLKSLDPEPSR